MEEARCKGRVVIAQTRQRREELESLGSTSISSVALRAQSSTAGLLDQAIYLVATAGRSPDIASSCFRLRVNVSEGKSDLLYEWCELLKEVVPCMTKRREGKGLGTKYMPTDVSPEDRAYCRLYIACVPLGRQLTTHRRDSPQNTS